MPSKYLVLTITEMPNPLPGPREAIPCRVLALGCAVCTVDHLKKFKPCVHHHRLNILGVTETDWDLRETPPTPPEETIPSPLPAS
jgi:hypothetical protein